MSEKAAYIRKWAWAKPSTLTTAHRVPMQIGMEKERKGQLREGFKSESVMKLDRRKSIGLRIRYQEIGTTKRRENQANKSAGWMPRHHTPKKDVASCEKLRGAASRH